MSATMVKEASTSSTSHVVVIPEGKYESAAMGVGGAPMVKYNNETEVVEVIGLINGGGDQLSKSGSNDESQENGVNKSKIRIQVSKTKKPLFFYINLAKKYIKQCYEVELTALGMAIPSAIIISEILIRNGLAVQKDVSISTVGGKEEKKGGRMLLKAQIEIVLGVADKMEESSVTLSSN